MFVVIRFVMQNWRFFVVSGPMCNMSKGNISNIDIVVQSGTDLLLECSVRYKGNLSPIMEWRSDVNETSCSARNSTISVHHKEDTLVSILEVSLADNCSELSLYFITYFSGPQKSSDGRMAANIPDYRFTWNPPRILFSEVIGKLYVWIYRK